MYKTDPALKAIFDQAAEITSPAERQAYLDKACQGNPDLRRRVVALLDAYEQAGSFLESPPVELQNTIEASSIAEQPGTVIGRYKLLQQIGEGGFGVVFMAEQVEPVRRKVALKIIKPGMDTKEVVARFEAERQALALMDHPNIARVFDAGATESGRPYFVMELVRGIPITDYCDQNHLVPQARLDLFMSVCHAVQHAHHKGIIHRDVKPNNVLVTLHDGAPVVKVIDFGVAKAIDRRLTERTLFTRFAEMIGTPLYMSPEQAEISGLDVDTRTDIYSLGVLLYELLTGATPFDKERLGKAAYDEIRRIIREEEPLRPSMRVSTMGGKATAVSEHRKTEPKKLSALLKGDLDWIVMKALEKDRTRRYATAKEFADDIQHYRTDQPVEARAPSPLYRFQKFVRRYRAATATIAAVAATLVAATVFSSWMAVRERSARQLLLAQVELAERANQTANQERDKARQAANDARFAIELIGSGLEAGNGMSGQSTDQTVSQMLQSVALRLDAITEPNPNVDAQVRYLIGWNYFLIGKDEEAAAQLQRSVQAQRSVYGRDSRTAKTLAVLAIACQNLGRSTEAVDYLRESMDIAREIAGDEDSNPESAVLTKLVDSLSEQGKAQAAQAIATQSLAIVRGMDSGTTNAAWAMTRVGDGFMALGEMKRGVACYREAVPMFEAAGDTLGAYRIWKRLGDRLREMEEWLDAREAHSQALQLSEKLGASGVQQRHESTMALSEDLLHLRDWPVAETIHRKFIQECGLGEDDPRLPDHWAFLDFAEFAQGKGEESKLIRDRPVSTSSGTRMAYAWVNLAAALSTAGKYDEAAQAYRKTLEFWARPDQHNPSNAWNRHELAFLHISLGVALEKSGRSDEAEQAYGRSIELHEQLKGEFPDDAEYRARTALSHRVLADFLLSRGRTEESKNEFARAIAGLRESLASAERTGNTASQSEIWMQLGDELRAQGKLFEAKDAYGRAIQLWDGLGERRLVRRAQACQGLRFVLADLRDWPGMESNSRQMLALVQNRPETVFAQVATMRWDLVWALEAQKKHQEAEAALRELISAFQASERDGKRVWANVLDQLAYAELVSRTSDDDASLQDALRVLTAVESQITHLLDVDWVRGWWHGVMAALQDKLGQEEEAVRHARVSLAKMSSGDLGVSILVQDELVRLLVAQGQSDDAESVLRNTLNDRRRRLGDDHVITHYACADLAELLIQLKKYAEAESLLQQAQAGLLAEVRVPQGEKQRVIRLLADACEGAGNPEQAAQWRTKLEESPVSEQPADETGVRSAK